jgi:hypothetical protein
VCRLFRIFQNFSPKRITTFTAFAALQGVRGSLLQLHTPRLATATKSAIADFRFQNKFEKNATKAQKHKKYEN